MLLGDRKSKRMNILFVPKQSLILCVAGDGVTHTRLPVACLLHNRLATETGQVAMSVNHSGSCFNSMMQQI